MPATSVLAILAGLLSAAPSAEVTAATLDVFSGPGGASLRTGSLRRGDRVVVRRDEGRWLAIEPPRGSFSWIEARAIRQMSESRARVIVEEARVRPGSPGARLPGPPACTLARGDVVRLIDRPSPNPVPGEKANPWRAIAPTRDEVRYVLAEGIGRRGPEGPASPPDPAPRLRLAALATIAPGADPDAQPAPELKAALDPIEARHRDALRGPMDRWDLGPIREAYQALLQRQDDAGSQAAVRARIEQVGRQEQLARDARELDSALDRSRRRDGTVAALNARQSDARRPTPEPYDLRGLLQPSSKQVNGQKVFALIAADGSTAAYLDPPAGLDASTMIGRKVGVRGTGRLDEDLNARLIDVRDLEPLEDLGARREPGMRPGGTAPGPHQCRNRNSLELISTHPRSSTAWRRSAAAARWAEAAASSVASGSRDRAVR